MAVNSEDTIAGPYTANGVTVSFPFGFKAMSGGEVAVLIRDGSGNDSFPDSDEYSVTLNDAGGGTVQFFIAPTTGQVYVFSDPDFTQGVTFASGQPYLPATVNEVNDRDVVRDLYLRALSRRSLVAPVGEELSLLPKKADRANKSLGFGADGLTLVPLTLGGADSALRTDLATTASGAALVAGRFGHLLEYQNADPYIRAGELLVSSQIVDQTAAVQAAADQADALGCGLMLTGDLRITGTITSARKIKGSNCRIFTTGMPAGASLNNMRPVFLFTSDGDGLVADTLGDLVFYGEDAVRNIVAARHNGRKRPISRNVKCYNLNVAAFYAQGPAPDSAVGYDDVNIDEATGNCCRDVLVENSWAQFTTARSLTTDGGPLNLQYVIGATIINPISTRGGVGVIAVGGKANLESDVSNPGQGDLPVYDAGGALIAGFERKCRNIHVIGGRTDTCTGAVVFIMCQDSWSDGHAGYRASDLLFDIEGSIDTYHLNFIANTAVNANLNSLIGNFFYNRRIGFIGGICIQPTGGTFIYRPRNSYQNPDNEGPVTIQLKSAVCTDPTGLPAVLGYGGADTQRNLRVIGGYMEQVRIALDGNNTHQVTVRGVEMVFPRAYTAAAFNAIAARVFSVGGFHGHSVVEDNRISFRAAMHAGTRAIRQYNTSNPARIETLRNKISGLPAGNIIELDQNSGLGGLFLSQGNTGDTVGNTIGQNQNGGSAATFTKTADNTTIAGVAM